MDRSASHLLGRDVDRGSKGSAERAYADCQDASSGDVTPMVAVRSRWHFQSPKRGNAPKACGKRIRTLLCQCASRSPPCFSHGTSVTRDQTDAKPCTARKFQTQRCSGLVTGFLLGFVDASEPGSSIQVLGSFSSSALPVGSSYDHLITWQELERAGATSGACACRHLCLLNHRPHTSKLSICNAVPYRACGPDRAPSPLNNTSSWDGSAAAGSAVASRLGIFERS